MLSCPSGPPPSGQGLKSRSLFRSCSSVSGTWSCDASSVGGEDGESQELTATGSSTASAFLGCRGHVSLFSLPLLKQEARQSARGQSGLFLPLTLLLLPDPLHYEGPGMEILLPAPEDGESSFLLQLKHRFSALMKCLCKMLRLRPSPPGGLSAPLPPCAPCWVSLVIPKCAPFLPVTAMSSWLR